MVTAARWTAAPTAESAPEIDDRRAGYPGLDPVPIGPPRTTSCAGAVSSPDRGTGGEGKGCKGAAARTASSIKLRCKPTFCHRAPGSPALDPDPNPGAPKDDPDNTPQRRQRRGPKCQIRVRAASSIFAPEVDLRLPSGRSARRHRIARPEDRIRSRDLSPAEGGSTTVPAMRELVAAIVAELGRRGVEVDSPHEFDPDRFRLDLRHQQRKLGGAK